MHASIVEISGLNVVTHVKSNTFAIIMARSRKMFLRCFAQAHSLTTLQEKCNTRIDCRNFGSEKKKLLPLLWPAVWSCFYTASLHRTYLRVSIVEMMSLNLDTYVKNMTFATSMARSRKMFLRCFAQVHSLTTLQEKNNARIDCRNFESDFCHIRNEQDFYHCYGPLEEVVFTLFRSSAFTYDTLRKE